MIANTFVLVGSSFLFHNAESAIKKKGKSGLFWLFATIVAGSIFLSVQAWEWNHLHHEGLWFDKHGIYGSCFFVMTGFHGAHVFIGILLIRGAFYASFSRAIIGRDAPPRSIISVSIGTL